MKAVIIGSGYVGLVTGACLAKLGHHVVCIDQREDRIEAIRNGKAPFFEPGLDAILAEVASTGHLKASMDLLAALADAELAMIAVGTPFKGGAIDLSQVEAAAVEIGRALRDRPDYLTVVVKSTVVPGSTDTLVRAILERESGKQAGEFGLAMNPEFLREGNAVEDFMQPDRIVIGAWDDRSAAALAELYQGFDCPKPVLSPRNAEMVKYASNALLATLVSFSNELAGLCEAKPGLDIETVMDGLHLDRRLSPVIDGLRRTPGLLNYLRAGVGYGGSCFPKDVAALRGIARVWGVETPLLDAVERVNESRCGKILHIIRSALGGAWAGQTIAVLGLAFKPYTDDLRESPALRIVDGLLAAGVTVRALDPAAEAAARAVYGEKISFHREAASLLEGTDAVVLATAWPEFAAWDWPALVDTMRQPIVIDGRNALRRVDWPQPTRYLPIGTALDNKEAKP